ncbi:MAG TPA: ABC transporter substrate-binding protein [Pirellulales bacterium]|nr:ABC transporter substrate-binding protein [Pirellulales bacterium]
MRRQPASPLPASVESALRKFGADIRVARVKRRLTSAMLADKLGVHRSTYSKLEGGDPAVGLGLYARALFELGLGTPLANLVDPKQDGVGIELDLQRLPKRVRRSTTPPLPAINAISEASRVLRIGIVATMSGPQALWGMVCKYAALATADLHNHNGGVEIDGQRYRIEIVARDDRLNPQEAARSVAALARQGIRYIIGPNVEQTFAAAAPVAERGGVMLFPYSFTRSCYSVPFENAVLGQVAGFQAWPLIYRYLRDAHGIRKVGVLAPNSPEGQMQRRETVAVAERLEMSVFVSPHSYEAGSEQFTAPLEVVLARRPDLIVLPNLAPLDAPGLIRTARRLGFSGLFATEAAQDIGVLNDGTGQDADGLLTVGGASTLAIRNACMDAFMERYCAIAGSWHDEAGTKAYALETVLATLRRAGAGAIDDIALFKHEIPYFAIRDPFLLAESTLQFVGSDYFGQKRQIGVPLVVNLVRNNQFEPVMVKRVA